MDQPLYSLSDEQEQDEILKMWESEKHGGLWEGNNRLPMPMVILMALIILTAFMITMPIWGQRPTAAIYQDHIKLMESPEVQRLATPEEKMKYVADTAMQMAKSKGDSRLVGDLERHPLTWDDLLNIAPGIKEVQSGKSKYAIDNYTVLGDRIVLANFEGNFVKSSPAFNGPGGMKSGADDYRERKQPWWDRGYSIDVFYVSYFCLVVAFIVKRLPHFSRKPNMAKAK
ncbi:MAG: hypothetical protein OEZ47_13020 [Gammaproteobacteria bacterium]|nr:hypothetical protein [Gammaproteobacteria bacterium]